MKKQKNRIAFFDQDGEPVIIDRSKDSIRDSVKPSLVDRKQKKRWSR